jgi:hypothetical protein
VEVPEIPGTGGVRTQAAGPRLLPADLALLIATGLGLKRTLPWAQVKGALVHVSLADAGEPVETVSETLGVPSLRTSMAPIKRFVGTTRSMGMSAADVSTVLDVAASARDVGEIVAGVSAKDAATRHSRWRAAGVPPSMLRPLDRVRAGVLRHVASTSPPGTPDHKALESAQEALGALLAEGVTIRNELDSVPIETYSAHPFTFTATFPAGGRVALVEPATEQTAQAPPSAPAGVPDVTRHRKGLGADPPQPEPGREPNRPEEARDNDATHQT